MSQLLQTPRVTRIATSLPCDLRQSQQATKFLLFQRPLHISNINLYMFERHYTNILLYLTFPKLLACVKVTATAVTLFRCACITAATDARSQHWPAILVHNNVVYLSNFMGETSREKQKILYINFFWILYTSQTKSHYFKSCMEWSCFAMLWWEWPLLVWLRPQRCICLLCVSAVYGVATPQGPNIQRVGLCVEHISTTSNTAAIFCHLWVS